MDKEIKVILICGGRDFDDWSLVGKTLTGVEFDKHWEQTIITGGARGADWLARAFAKYWDFNYREYPANWKKHGKAAGIIRNQQMLDEEEVDLVIAFPGGRGTADMVSRARKKGIEVREIKRDET